MDDAVDVDVTDEFVLFNDEVGGNAAAVVEFNVVLVILCLPVVATVLLPLAGEPKGVEEVLTTINEEQTLVAVSLCKLLLLADLPPANKLLWLACLDGCETADDDNEEDGRLIEPPATNLPALASCLLELLTIELAEPAANGFFRLLLQPPAFSLVVVVNLLLGPSILV